MITGILLLSIGLLTAQAGKPLSRAGQIPKGAKIMTTKGRPTTFPPCLHKVNPAQVLKLGRYEAHITIAENHLNVTRTVTFFPNTAWKKMCNHHLKIGFPLTPSVTRGKQERFLFSSPPGSRSEVAISLFHRDRFKQGSTLTIKGFLGGAIKLPPLSGNPTDKSLVFSLEQLQMPLPEPQKDGMQKLGLALSQFNDFALHPSFAFKIELQLNRGWVFHGATLPDERHLEGRVSWKGRRLPKEDLQILFADFDVNDTSPGHKKDDTDPPTSLMLFTIAGMAVISGGILFFIGVRRRKKGNTPSEK